MVVQDDPGVKLQALMPAAEPEGVEDANSPSEGNKP
jgi:hypothetical protein